MNDRDYFAAHAPLPIPDWFKGEYSGDMPAIPDVPAHWSALQSAQFSDLKEGISMIANASREVAEFYSIWLDAKGKHAAWRDRQREKKYFSWRWHYADQMMASRKANETISRASAPPAAPT
jgi:hypothetical protein